MARDPGCIFCRIIEGEIPALVVHQSDSVLAFLDVGPLSEGHILVIPKDHYTRLTEMPPERCAAVAAELPKLGRAMLEVTGADAFNLLQNNGSASGQVVEHVHFHLIPRIPNDNLGYRWNAGTYPPGRDVEVADAYKAALAQAR